MFAFPIRARHVKFAKTPVFPAQAECILVFSPEDVFGGRDRGTPLVLRGENIRTYWDANKGRSWVETQRRMKTLRVDCVVDGYDIRVTGGEISISFDCRSEDHFTHSLNLFADLPLYLSLFLGHAVVVDAFYGSIGDCSFNCEIMSGQFSFHVTEEERQKELVGLAFDMAFRRASAGNPRLMAALGYLYSARLIWAQSYYSSEFLPEVGLNLCKALDVLFTDSRDQLREELSKLGFAKEEIESKYVPLTLIRNDLDVAHPTLFIPTEEQRNTFDSFVSRALSQVEEVIRRVVEQSTSGKYEILPYDVDKQEARREKLLRHLSQYV